MKLLSRISTGFPTFVDGLDERTAELRALREQAPPEAVAELEDRIDDHEQVTDQVYADSPDRGRFRGKSWEVALLEIIDNRCGPQASNLGYVRPTIIADA